MKLRAFLKWFTTKLDDGMIYTDETSIYGNTSGYAVIYTERMYQERVERKIIRAMT